MGFLNLFDKGFRYSIKNNTNDESKSSSIIKIKDADWEHILCPYCFETFSHDQVHFRSVTVKNALSDEQLEELYGDDDDLLEEKTEENDIARKFEERKEDPELERFGSRFGIILNQREEKNNWKSPVIRPMIDNEMLYHKNTADSLIYIDKFLSGVKDYYAGESTQRLCPHCHNRLSPNYGRNKVIYISVVGSRGAGKSIYLYQLLKNSKKTLADAGIYLNCIYNIRKNFDLHGKPLFNWEINYIWEYGKATPIIVDITVDGLGKKEDYTLVFYDYDIVGEDCIDFNCLLTYGPYLLESQAIIMLLDSEQFQALAMGNVINEVDMVTETLVEFFENSGKSKEECPIMAATLSKSDRIRQKVLNSNIPGVNENSVIFKNIDRKNDKRGFYQRSYREMSGAINSLMKKLQPTGYIQMKLDNYFKETAFFAISSLGVSPQPKYNIGSKEEPLYIDLDPNSGAEEAIENLKRPNGPNPPLYRGKRQVFLGYNPEDDSEVILSFDEIRKSTSMIEYWLEQQPMPCRIEEPLTWILYKFGVIEGIDA